jgi:hypothetical protein
VFRASGKGGAFLKGAKLPHAFVAGTLREI